MKTSKRSFLFKRKEEKKTTENWDRLKSMMKQCKYCGKVPEIKFDMDEELYFLECCESYKHVKFNYLEDSINHHVGFKKPGIITRLKGALTS